MLTTQFQFPSLLTVSRFVSGSFVSTCNFIILEKGFGWEFISLAGNWFDVLGLVHVCIDMVVEKACHRKLFCVKVASILLILWFSLGCFDCLFLVP